MRCWAIVVVNASLNTPFGATWEVTKPLSETASSPFVSANLTSSMLLVSDEGRQLRLWRHSLAVFEGFVERPLKGITEIRIIWQVEQAIK